MARKTISLTGELHMNATGFSVTVDALETLKIVGIAYGVYDHAEDLRDCRVTLENGERPALVVQEDVSLHGSPFWETVRTITDDPERIRQYVAFRETLKMFQQIEREREAVNRALPPRGRIAMSDNHLTILVVEPGKPPYPRQIPDTLQAMQEIVGGDIDATYPYEDPVALIFNSSGKFAGLQPNRLLRLENGDPYDVVCGTFFLAGLGGETFVSLTPEQLRKYESLYSREMLFPLPKKKERRNEHER